MRKACLVLPIARFDIKTFAAITRKSFKYLYLVLERILVCGTNQRYIFILSSKSIRALLITTALEDQSLIFIC